MKEEGSRSSVSKALALSISFVSNPAIVIYLAMAFKGLLVTGFY